LGLGGSFSAQGGAEPRGGIPRATQGAEKFFQGGGGWVLKKKHLPGNQNPG